MAWMVLWEGMIQEIQNRRFLPNKAELIQDLKMYGLKLGPGNKVVLIDDTYSFCGDVMQPGSGYKTCTICCTSNRYSQGEICK